MTPDRVEAALLELDALLAKYAVDDEEVAALAAGLAPLFAQLHARQGALAVEWQDVAGARWFSEGRLARHAGLEEAYARFRLAVCGSESEVLTQLRADRAARS